MGIEPEQVSPDNSPAENRYLVYLVKGHSRRPFLRTNDLPDQKTSPWTPKFFIYNRIPFSQAGRHGFESRLPLQKPPSS
jgi:hypothetical protein